MSLIRAATGPPQIDYRIVPLEYNFKVAAGSDRQEVLRSVRILGVATMFGRVEAGVFLMGLLVAARPEDRELRAELVSALRHTRTPACAALLLDQLVSLPESPEYTPLLEILLDVLAEMPMAFIEQRLLALARDERFSQAQRRGFLQVLEDADSLSFGYTPRDVDGTKGLV